MPKGSEIWIIIGLAAVLFWTVRRAAEMDPP